MTKEEWEIRTNEKFVEMCELVYNTYKKNYFILDKIKVREKQIIHNEIATFVYHPNPSYRISFEIFELSNKELCIYVNDSWYVDHKWYDEKLFGCYTNGISHIEHYRTDKPTFGWYEFGIIIDGIKKLLV